MRAYDRLADGLRQAGGGDGVISRAEADTLVDELKRDGRGTEALAARKLFALIDEFDAARGARVTDYDLSRARPLVEMWMADGDGRLSALGQALGELGHVGRYDNQQYIQQAWPERGMAHIASLLKQAAGPDGVVSRDDARRMVEALEAQGRGTEAHGADMFYRFIDHRDHRAGARVTATDIDVAVDYARDHLLRNKDTDGNQRYDQAERQSFSTTAKAFLHTGPLVVFGIAPGAIQGPAPTLPGPGLDRFTENQPMPAGWAPTATVDQGQVTRDAQGALVLTGVSGADLAETRFLEAALGQAYDNVLQHRAWPQGSPADLSGNGELRHGTWTDALTGETYRIAHWNDIDDSSFVYYFAESQGSTAADPRFELKHSVYLN
jgi:hypothetical protein